jgi:hypothetical protein
MSHKATLTPRAAALLIGLALLFAGAATYAEEEQVTLSGYIDAADYDDDGNVTAVSIYDSAWGDVLISKEGKGKELIKHVDAGVELSGRIVELDDESGYSYEITVSAFKLEEPEDDRVKM